MALRKIIGVLLLLEIILFAHLLTILTQADTTSWIAAEGGHVTQVNLQGSAQDVWGGVYGRMRTFGGTAISVQGGQVINQDIYAANESCVRTDVIASAVPIDLATLVPTTTAAADAILGIDTTNPLSVTQMYTSKLIFNVAGKELSLFTTKTKGAITDYHQGVAQTSGGTLVFVTRTVGNGQAFNGQAAEYQFILPAGSWQVTYDTTDTCTVLEETPEEEERKNRTRVFISLPDRICVNQTQEYVVVTSLERVICRVVDQDNNRCKPTAATVTVLQNGQEVLAQETTTGYLDFTPETDAHYVIQAEVDGKNYHRSFKAKYCEDFTTGNGTKEFISVPRKDLPLEDPPQPQTPAAAVAIAQVEYILIVWITAVIMLLSAIAYYEVYKDTSVRLLKARIWLLKRVRRK